MADTELDIEKHLKDNETHYLSAFQRSSNKGYLYGYSAEAEAAARAAKGEPYGPTLARLKGEEPGVWSCSWRYSGGIIADIRNTHYNTKEDYMNFYCSAEEGVVTDTVKECFERMGWEKYPWPEDGI